MLQHIYIYIYTYTYLSLYIYVYIYIYIILAGRAPCGRGRPGEERGGEARTPE